MANAAPRAPLSKRRGVGLSFNISKQTNEQKANIAKRENKDLLDKISAINLLPPAAQPSINLDKHLFSTEEINRIITPIEEQFNPENIRLINDKLIDVKHKIVINHRIDAKQYNDVFIISDTHADLRKVYSILINSRMIETSFNPYNDDILKPELISKAEWIPSNTLLIIVGDLVDGRRKSISVDDPDGSFELKLHMLFYNLRLQAIKKNSNIIFTLGNHDCETLNDNNDLLDDYVHSSSKTYFNIIGNVNIRRDALKPFYELSPYIFISLSTPSHENEIVCVHAGLHTENIDIDRNELEKLQSAINRYGLDLLNDYYNKIYIDTTLNFDKTGTQKQNGSIWTRFYANMNENDCKRLNVGYDDNKYKTIVVGHCPTNTDSFQNITKIMSDNPEIYDHCQTNIEDIEGKAGCVVTRCNEEPLDGNIKGAPRIVLVDTGLSSSFRFNQVKLSENPILYQKSKEEYNNNRGTELLHLCHDSDYYSVDRYYNTITRFLVSPSEQTERMVYQTLSLDSIKRKYLKYKNKYFSLKNSNI
jgi:hypothetical protein